MDEIHEALLTASDNRLQEGISDILLETVFYQDNDENFYYEFLMGILAPIKGYNVKPNRETGTNRSGIYLEPKSRHTPAIIIEIKIAKTFEEIESKCDEALTQIETKKYVQDLNQSGFTKVAKVGIAFCGKDCEVKSIW